MSDTHMHPGVCGLLEVFSVATDTDPNAIWNRLKHSNYSSCLQLESGTRYVGTSNEAFS